RAVGAGAAGRWETCGDCVRALRGGGPRAAGAGHGCAQAEPPLLAQIIGNLAGRAGPRLLLPPPPEGLLREENGILRRYTSRLPLNLVRLKLDIYRRQWKGRVVHDDERLYEFHTRRSLSFWQRCLGQRAGLAVQVQLAPATAAPGAAATTVLVQLRPIHCSRDEGSQILEAIGPLLLESALDCFEMASERRAQERLTWPHPVAVRFVLPDRRLGEVVSCQGKDISRTGIGFYLPSSLPTTQICVELPTTRQTPGFSVAAQIVRLQRHDQRCFDVGAAFALGAEA